MPGSWEYGSGAPPDPPKGAEELVSLPFDAANVESLEVRGLADYGIPDLKIPEPSNAQYRALARYVDRTSASVRSGEIARRYAEAIAAGDDEKADAACAAIDADTYEILALVCSQRVTAAQLEALPVRLFREFSYWLTGELLDLRVKDRYATFTDPRSKPAERPTMSANEVR